MSKLSDNEIIKALECCTKKRKGEEIPCTDCPYDECNLVGGKSERQTNGTCQSWLMKDTLNLINRLQVENEGLKESNRLLINNPVLIQQDNLINNIKAEAYKECIEKVKSIATKKKIVYVADTSIQEQKIGWLEIQETALDNLLKELVGEDNV